MTNPNSVKMTEEQYIKLTLAKREISDTIRQALKDAGLTYRDAVEIMPTNYTQLARVTAGNGYTIDTLLVILQSLGYKLTIEKE